LPQLGQNWFDFKVQKGKLKLIEFSIWLEQPDKDPTRSDEQKQTQEKVKKNAFSFEKCPVKPR